jgi:hypothetical protein
MSRGASYWCAPSQSSCRGTLLYAPRGTRHSGGCFGPAVVLRKGGVSARALVASLQSHGLRARLPPVLSSPRTICEVAKRQHTMVLSKICERYVRCALADHQVHSNEALEDGGPRWLAQPTLHHAKDLADAGLARVCRDENVFDVFGLGGGILWEGTGSATHGKMVRWRTGAGPLAGLGFLLSLSLTLTLVAPLTDFSNDILSSARRRSSPQSPIVGRADGRACRGVRGRGGGGGRGVVASSAAGGI